MEMYFVISGAMKRTRNASEADAVEFAKKLITAQGDGKALHRNKPPFYVVKLVKIVEKAPPPTVVRDPAESDFQPTPSVTEEPED